MNEIGQQQIEPKRVKRALVLPGGGGRGAYQVGVVKAFKEMDVTFDFAFGTSIGALNATFYAQGDIKKLEDVWSHLRSKDIYKLPDPAQLGQMIFGQKLGILDTSPLEEMIRREVDLHKIKTGGIKVGLFTTDLCSLETRLITTDNIVSTNELVDVLMATSAVPIAFPPRHLNGKGLWVDGGLVKNTPMQAVIDMGAEEIYVVLLHPETIDACPTNILQVVARCLDIVLDASANKELQTLQLYNRLIDEGASEAAGMRRVNIHVFQPRTPVNVNLLEIDPERSRQLIHQGYEDAISHLATIKKTLPAQEPAVIAKSVAPH